MRGICHILFVNIQFIHCLEILSVSKDTNLNAYIKQIIWWAYLDIVSTVITTGGKMSANKAIKTPASTCIIVPASTGLRVPAGTGMRQITSDYLYTT